MSLSKAACISHKTTIDVSKIEEAKLQKYYVQGGAQRVRKKNVPKFSTGGIEALLCTEKRFRSAAKKLRVTTGRDLFEYFEEVLEDEAEEKWLNIADNVADADRTTARFDQAIEEFYLKYVNNQARDDMFDYLMSSQVSKPRDVSVQSHADRIQTLIGYANKLPGTEPPKTDDQIKKMIYNSFPEKWRQDYVKSALGNIITCMSHEKRFSDTDECNKRKATFQDSETSNKRTKENSQDTDDSNKINKSSSDLPVTNPCRHHYGTHEWKNCYLNKQSKRYRPEAAQRFFESKRAGQKGGFYNNDRDNGRGRGYNNTFQHQHPHSNSTHGRTQNQQNYGYHMDGCHSNSSVRQFESHHLDTFGQPVCDKIYFDHDSGRSYTRQYH